MAGLYLPLHFVPGTLGLLRATLIVLTHWLYYVASRKAGHYVLETKENGFKEILDRYTKLVELFIGLAAGAVVLIAGFNARPNSWRLASSLVFLSASVVLAMTCITCLIYFYEEWNLENLPHHQNQSYKRWKHILVNVTGFSALWCFAFGYISIGFAIGLQSN